MKDESPYYFTIVILYPYLNAPTFAINGNGGLNSGSTLSGVWKLYLLTTLIIKKMRKMRNQLSYNIGRFLANLTTI